MGSHAAVIVEKRSPLFNGRDALNIRKKSTNRAIYYCGHLFSFEHLQFVAPVILSSGHITARAHRDAKIVTVMRVGFLGREKPSLVRRTCIHVMDSKNHILRHFTANTMLTSVFFSGYVFNNSTIVAHFYPMAQPWVWFFRYSPPPP